MRKVALWTMIGILGGLGCSPSLPEDCNTNADCPEGQACNMAIQTCIRVDADLGASPHDAHEPTDGSDVDAHIARDAEPVVATDATMITDSVPADSWVGIDGSIRDGSLPPDAVAPPLEDATLPMDAVVHDATPTDVGIPPDANLPDTTLPDSGPLDATMADAGCDEGEHCIVQCNPAPAGEVCNGIDDDCDGHIDDGVQNACGDCGPVPVEVCNGRDDDCNGAVDERCECTDDFTPVDITCGRGRCQNVGQTICEAGVIVSLCEPNPRPTDSDITCDGIDEDCDGTADDDFVTGTSQCGTGMCARTGQLQCQEGHVVSTCTPGTPADQEICNHLDDNCNGQVDEGCIPPPPDPDAGAEDAASPPVDSTLPPVDATPPPVDASVGLDSETPPLDAGPRDANLVDANPPDADLGDAAPITETCNGIDDDGDGTVDEGDDGSPLSQPCYEGPDGTQGVGLCHGGTQTCANGAYGACGGQVTPTAEDPLECDNLDNDCNGLVDENAPDMDNDGWSLCEDCDDEENRVNPGHVEVCDALDNNCTGKYNEGIPNQCICMDRDRDRIPDCSTTGPNIEPSWQYFVPADGNALRDCNDALDGHGAAPGQACP